MNANAQNSFNDMQLQINRDSPVPLHHQVRNYLLGSIERGELLPGQQLLQEKEYASRFGISLAPVRQAILDLVKEGYLYRVPGKGTFVREQKVEEKKPEAKPEEKRAASVEFTVQVGVFNNPNGAITKLSAAGVPYYTEAKGSLTRVLAGPFASREAAETALRQLKGMGLVEQGRITQKTG